MRRALIAAVSALLLAGCAAPDDDPLVIESKAGVGYKIGNKWPAGTWETKGAFGGRCNWAIRSELTNKPATLLDSGHVQVGEAKRVAVEAGEFFVGSGCKPWRFTG
jgi:opacity protein-like surface antigen